MQESNDKVIYDVKKDLYLWPTGTKLKLSDNFSTEEFNSPRADMQQISGLLVEKLQRIRNEINMPLTITSGYRSSAYQQALRDRGYPTTALGNVSQHELGRAIYHIAKHRGYKSNSKATEVNTDEKSKIFKGYDDKIGIEETRKNLDNSKYKTIGEYLNSLDSHEIRIRNRFTTRDMYEDEINKILEKQAVYYPDLLNEKNKEKIKQNEEQTGSGNKKRNYLTMQIYFSTYFVPC